LTASVDGVVLWFTPNGHSLNYRSSIIHGDAEIVESCEEKRYAMHLLMNHMSRRRRSATNPVDAKAMKHVQVIRVKILGASAKINNLRVATGKFDPASVGERQDVFTGVVPLYEVLGEPVSSGVLPGRESQMQMEIEEEPRGESPRGEGGAARRSRAEDSGDH
jgi:hypothetical protein